jgi:hypothetical protein
MSRRTITLVAAVLVASAAAATTIATRTGASEKGGLSRLSNAGRPVKLQGDVMARQVGVRHTFLLAVRGARALYLLETSHGTCLGSGSAADVGQIGAVECPQGPFPTAERPVVDLSVYESTSRGRREVSLYRAEGVAADGVAAIAFLRPSGKVALKVPVSGNVFSAASVPPGPIAGIAAFDSADKELWRSP